MRNSIKKGMSRHKIQEIEHTPGYVFCNIYVIPTKAEIASFFRSVRFDRVAYPENFNYFEKGVTSLRGVYVSNVYVRFSDLVTSTW